MSDWEDRDASSQGAPGIFVDRVGESQALDAALREHRARIEANTISTREFRNVLTFYGDGGVGKTELSRRLEHWLRGDQGTTYVDWGPSPATTVDAIVRWDANDSRGALDVVELLAGMRSQLGAIQRTWAAFDLAFADFYRVMKPGQDFRLRTPGHVETTMSEVVGGLVSDAVSVTDLAVSGGVGAGVFGVSRRLVAGAYARSKARRVMGEYPQLAEVIEACEVLPGSPRDVAAVAARACFLISEEVHRMAAADRPTVVVFVDHMERLQVPGRTHGGEWSLNKLVARLPYFLFVITGRNSLRWHESSATHLDERGRSAWPLLGLEPPPTDEPHQHRIGNLSTGDAEQFLNASLERLHVPVEAGLVTHLAGATDGWPLHLDTLVAVADERSDRSTPLTAADLAGPLPDLVERLLHDLPEDQADAFRASCLLPYFDTAFVAAAGDVSRGAVERLTGRTIVRANPSSAYPYRIHETLRELVRTAGSTAHGGWAVDDWRTHAERALAEAERRFHAAMAAHDDLGAVASLALGINVAAENAVDGAWLVPAIRTSPSIIRLAELLPAKNPPAATAEVANILDFLRTRTPRRDDATDELRDVIDRRTSVSSTAGLWHAYDLRFQCRWDETLAQFDQLLTDFDDRPSLYLYQKVVTLRIARRFRDAMTYLPRLTAEQQQRTLDSIGRSHGRLTAEGTARLRRVADAAPSRRYQVEVLADWLVVQHRASGARLEDALDLHHQAELIGHQAALAEAATVIGQMNIFDDETFATRSTELEELSRHRSRPFTSWPMLLAMRAWACDEAEHGIRAAEILNSLECRPTAFIAIEVLLEHLGHDVRPQPAQWLEPEDDVRARWMAVHTAVRDRAARSRTP